jgi:hypothetical protein
MKTKTIKKVSQTEITKLVSLLNQNGVPVITGDKIPKRAGK